MLVIDELTYRTGNLIMACKVTDVKGREGALAASLLPNPMASASEKQVTQAPSRGSSYSSCSAHAPNQPS